MAEAVQWEAGVATFAGDEKIEIAFEKVIAETQIGLRLLPFGITISSPTFWTSSCQLQLYTRIPWRSLQMLLLRPLPGQLNWNLQRLTQALVFGKCFSSDSNVQPGWEPLTLCGRDTVGLLQWVTPLYHPLSWVQVKSVACFWLITCDKDNGMSFSWLSYVIRTIGVGTCGETPQPLVLLKDNSESILNVSQHSSGIESVYIVQTVLAVSEKVVLAMFHLWAL